VKPQRTTITLAKHETLRSGPALPGLGHAAITRTYYGHAFPVLLEVVYAID
jgi:hypothetical protein